MKVSFKTRLEAIDWIAQYAEGEGLFEVLREQLNLNYCRTGKLFIELDTQNGEVVLLNG